MLTIETQITNYIVCLIFCSKASDSAGGNVRTLLCRALKDLKNDTRMKEKEARFFAKICHFYGIGKRYSE